MLETLRSALDLLLVIVGFGMVIFIHELGHFLAAKWAGVRVHQFAVGFGQAACSWRRGLGFHLGSTEKEYERMLKDDAQGVATNDAARISPTEYRLNWIPFGGYVKMLGQEDLDPAATSQAPDSYSRKPIWKRMVIISAGVVMNIVLAATLFVVVYMVGREAPTPRIGAIAPGSPASEAHLVSGDPSGTPASLQPGDTVTRINGKTLKSFNDISLEVVMARGGAPIDIEVMRPGAPEPLVFEATPQKSDVTGMLEVGMAPAVSTRVISPARRTPSRREDILAALLDAGLVGVEPGMTLTSVNGKPAEGHWTLEHAIESSGGQTVSLEFRAEAGEIVNVDLAPRPGLEIARVRIPGGTDEALQPHLLGLAPAVQVGSLEARAEKAGLRIGDVIVQVGPVAWPDMAAMIGAIRQRPRETVAITVLRDGAYLDLLAPVDSKGRIGFGVSFSTGNYAVLSRVPAPLQTQTSSKDQKGMNPDQPSDVPASVQNAPAPLPAARLELPPGVVILSVDDRDVTNFFDLRRSLRTVTAAAHTAGDGADLTLTVRLPFSETFNDGAAETVVWSLTAEEVAQLHALGWRNPVSPVLFEIEETMLRTSNPLQAVVWGVQDTHNMMLKTYLTFVRLFQGTVQVDQLKGPVGIAHLGTLVAERGLMDLFFFLGLISVNLAVINFLPIPIADGGHFVMLLLEKIMGKPVSPAIQNVAALAGLALIGVVFVVVTYNDLVGLFGS